MTLTTKKLYVSILAAILFPSVPYVANAATSVFASDAAAVASSQQTAPNTDQASDGKTKTKTSKVSASTQGAQTLQTVIVTGVPTVSGVTTHQASFLASTMDRVQIKQFSAINTDDLLRSIPTVFPEPTGGMGGNNVDVAGYPPGDGLTFITFELEGMPIWPLYNEGDVGNFEDALVQFDDTIGSLQSIQGGPSVVSGAGQPGITANMLLRRGTPQTSGEVGVTLLSEGGYRFNGFAGGPVGKSGWNASVGGFLLKSQGIRDSQYPADQGGQVTATLSKDFDNSSLIFYARRLDLNAQFVTDTPLINDKTGEFSAYPGFDPLTGTFSSVHNRYLFLASQACYTAGCTPGGRTYDFQQGHGAHMSLVGSNFQYFGPDGWSFSNGFQAMKAYAPEMGFFSTGQNPTALENVVATQALKSGFAPGTYTTSAALRTSQPATLDSIVTVQTPVVEQNRPRSLADQFKFSRDFDNGNTLSGGAYVAATQNSRFGINAPYRIILQAKSNPVPVVVSITPNNGSALPLTDTQGVFTVPASPQGDNKETYHENIGAVFASDTWRLDKWVLTGGARLAEDSVRGHYHLTKNTDMDANPDTLYNNFGQVFLPETKNIKYSNILKSGMLGATYLLSDNSSVYGNISYGVSPNHFDVIRNVPQAANVVQTIHNYTVGYKFGLPYLFLSVQGYHREFLHSAGAFNLADGGVVVTFGTGLRANGAILQLRVGPFSGFKVDLTADVVDARVIDPKCHEFINQGGVGVCTSGNGNHPGRQPNFQYTVRPNYKVNTSFGYLELWTLFNHVGYRTATPESPLGIYNVIGVGAAAGIGDHWVTTLRGTNVTDQIGLTEGNSRIFSGAENAGGVILARGLPGHEYNLQIEYKF